MAYTRISKKIGQTTEQSLKKRFFDFKHPAGFASINKLKEAVPRKERSAVLPWLRAQSEYTTYAPRRRHFPMNFYLSTRPDQCWEIDLIIFDSIREENKPMRYAMLVSDTYDKYLWGELMAQKTGAAATRAFETILERAKGRVCDVLRGDAGKEWINSTFARMLKKYNITFQIAGGIVKGGYIESVVKTIKNKLYKIFYFRGSYSYTDIFQDVIDTYNRTRHSRTLIAPGDVTVDDHFNIWFRKYLSHVRGPPAKPKFKVGQYVRLQINRQGNVLLDRGYFQSYTEEIFRIVRVQTKHRTGYLAQVLYHLEDLEGEPIKTGAYEDELIPVRYDPESAEFRIEKIINSRRNRETGLLEHLVKFKGYPKSMNRYIPANSIRHL